MTGLVSEKFQVTKIAAADFATTYPNVGVDMEAVEVDTTTVSTISLMTVGRDVTNSSRSISISAATIVPRNSR